MKFFRLVLPVMVILVLLFSGCNTGLNIKNEPAATNKPIILKMDSKIAYPFYKGRIDQKKYGLLDQKGNVILKPKYIDIADFQSNGMAIVSIKDPTFYSLQGLINAEGKETLAVKYAIVNSYSEGVAILKNTDDTYTAIDENCNSLFTIKDGELSDFHDGVAVCSITKGDNTYYGCVDKTGTFVVQPIYDSIRDFFGGRTIAVKSDQSYIIDITGKELKNLGDKGIPYNQDGFIEYYDVIKTDSYGLMDKDGKSLFHNRFPKGYKDGYSDGFKDGYSVIHSYNSQNFINFVIDVTGKKCYTLKNHLIENLGDGYFEVSEKVSNEIAYEANYSNPIHALFNAKGKQITEYKFYQITDANDGNFCVSDDKYTFLIDRKGKQIRNFPKLNGVGYITKVGNLYRVEIDGLLSYLDSKGHIVYQETSSISLSKGVTADIKVMLNDNSHMVQYPHISGVKDNKIKNIINTKLKQWLIADMKRFDDKQDPTLSSFFGETDVQLLGNILSVRLNASAQTIGGGVSGFHWEEYKHLNINNGYSLKLDDLFLKNSGYLNRINQLIRQQMKTREDLYDFIDKNFIVAEKNWEFTILKQGIGIVFQPGDIAPKGLGAKVFVITFSDLSDLINKDGTFWKALKG